jgi:hypothetical protein
MTTLNNSLRLGTTCSTKSKCPVEEMGRNSVIPSTIPRKITDSHSGMANG